MRFRNLTNGLSRLIGLDPSAQRTSFVSTTGRRFVAWAPPRDFYLALFLYIFLASLFCAHLLANPVHGVTADNPHDHALVSYFLQAEAHALWHGHNPLFVNTINAPDGANAMWNTGLLVPAILVSPLSVSLGGTFAFNFLLFVGLVGSALSAQLVIRRYIKSWWPPILAGAIFGFSPAMTHEAIGHLHIVFLVLVPPLLSGVVQAFLCPPTRWGGVRLGLLAAAQLLTSEEIFACTAIAALLILLMLALSRPMAVIGACRLAASRVAMSIVVFSVCVAYPLAFQFYGPRQQTGSPFGPDIFKSDLRGFTSGDAGLLFHLAPVPAKAISPGGLPEAAAYLGWPLCIIVALAFVIGWRDLRIRAAAAAAMCLALFSLGGRILLDGHKTTHHGPWALVNSLPLLNNILPNRFGVLVAGFAGFILAVALDTWPKRFGLSPKLGAALCLAIAVAVAVPLIPHPLQVHSTSATPLLISSGESKRVIPNGSTVLVLPFPTGGDTTAMDWQAQDGLRWKMPGGFYLGPACGGRHCKARGVLVANERATGRLLDAVADGSRGPESITPDDIAQAQSDLAVWGVTEVLVGPCPNQQRYADALKTLLNSPGTVAMDSRVWALTR